MSKHSDIVQFHAHAENCALICSKLVCDDHASISKGLTIAENDWEAWRVGKVERYTQTFSPVFVNEQLEKRERKGRSRDGILTE